MNRVHFLSEEFCFVAFFAVWVFVFAYVEDFIHSAMKRVRLKGVADLVHQCEHDFMHLGMTRAIALAIEFVRIGPDVFLRELDLGSFIELRVHFEQLVVVRLP